MKRREAGFQLWRRAIWHSSCWTLERSALRVINLKRNESWMEFSAIKLL